MRLRHGLHHGFGPVAAEHRHVGDVEVGVVVAVHVAEMPAACPRRRTAAGGRRRCGATTSGRRSASRSSPGSKRSIDPAWLSMKAASSRSLSSASLRRSMPGATAVSVMPLGLSVVPSPGQRTLAGDAQVERVHGAGVVARVDHAGARCRHGSGRAPERRSWPLRRTWSRSRDRSWCRSRTRGRPRTRRTRCPPRSPACPSLRLRGRTTAGDRRWGSDRWRGTTRACRRRPRSPPVPNRRRGGAGDPSANAPPGTNVPVQVG